MKKVTALAKEESSAMTPEKAADIVLRAKAGEANISRRTAAAALDALPPELRPRSNIEFAAVEAFLPLVCGENVISQEMARRDLAKKRREIAGPNPSPLEDMLAGRVALLWFQAEMYNAICSGEGSCTLTQSAHRMKRADMANRQFLAAVKTLATVRRLSLPAVQLNIATNGGQQVNVSGDVNRDGMP